MTQDILELVSSLTASNLDNTDAVQENVASFVSELNTEWIHESIQLKENPGKGVVGTSLAYAWLTNESSQQINDKAYTKNCLC